MGWVSGPAPDDERFLDDLQRRTFAWFADAAHPDTGLVPDRWPRPDSCSVAAVGFGLTAWGVGQSRGWLTRHDAVRRTLATLRLLHDAPQGEAATGTSGHRGFFHHFLDPATGLRWSDDVELSSVDTALLLGGVLFAERWFDGDDAAEREIRTLADALHRRVEWPWMQARPPLISMGWLPGKGFLDADWCGYNEAMLVVLLALGSPTHPVGDDAWPAWAASYGRTWEEFHGRTHLGFGPLFGHQYSHVWVDFRGVRDDWGRAHGLDYAENSRRAAHAQQAYAVANPGGFRGYDQDVWGLTACDGPGEGTHLVDGREVRTHGYLARGAGPGWVEDDGTIAPTAAGGCLPFAPEIALPALRAMADRYGDALLTEHGFLDAINPTVGWVDDQHLGIDQGPILLMAENLRTGLVWDVVRGHPVLRRGLARAGFRPAR
ncbi:glucoamylase family protein [Lapillicoccus jejuensis]|uniref:Glycoamylase-like domain-containing protein n=1 Tax=Lapillicoccus jejuensis TaxID=402171 RepID=A0A542DYG3_9MICO|nr:hypothetical protein FB458_1181 [Lapillicoccus jejuensis]